MQAAVCITNAFVEGQIKKVLSMHSFEITRFDFGQALCEAVSTGLTADLVILGIESNVGEEALSNLRTGLYLRKNCGWNGPILIISETLDYDITIFDLQPVRYILKPLETNKLESFVEGMKADILGLEKAIICKIRGSRTAIPMKRIRYIPSLNKKVLIHSIDGKYECYMKLEEIAQQVGDAFLHTHQSYLVNRTYIARVFRDHVELDNDQQIPISRRHKEYILKAFYFA